jgi:signal transduction histidine kinase
MKPFLLFFLAFVMSLCGAAQSPMPDAGHATGKQEQLQMLKRTCDSLNNAEDYAASLKAARYGLQLTPANDYDNLSLFNFYIGTIYMGLEGDTSIRHLEKSLHYGRLSGVGKRVTSALYRLFYMYIYMDGYTKQRDILLPEVLRVADTTHSIDLKKDMYLVLSDYYSVIGIREKQINYLLANLELFKQKIDLKIFNSNDSANLGVAYIKIGTTYLEMKQPQKALEYTTRARPFLHLYKSALANYYQDMSNAYLQLNRPATAGFYYDTLTRMVQQEFNIADGWNIRMATDLLFAKHYLNHKQPDSALQYMNKAKMLVGTSVKDTLTISKYDYMMGKTLLASNAYAGALTHLKRAEKLGPEIGLEAYADVLRELALCYSGLGQWHMAAGYYARYLPIRDSLYTSSSQQSLANAEARFQNKEKQHQIDTKNLQLSKAHSQRLWLTVGLTMAGLVALLLIIIYRNKKKTADILDEKNKALAKLNDDLDQSNRTKAKLFGIISHDLRSPISQVYQFLKLQQLAPNALSVDQKSTLSQKIQTATGSLLETMEDLLIWSKTQMDSFNAAVEEVAVLSTITTCQKLMQLNGEAKNIIYQNTIPESLMVRTDSYYLQAIIRNLLQNAIKASPLNGLIKISCEEKPGTVVISILNEGGAYTQREYETFIANNENAKNLSGIGLRLVHELSQKIEATILFENPAANTSQVNIVLPNR